MKKIALMILAVSSLATASSVEKVENYLKKEFEDPLKVKCVSNIDISCKVSNFTKDYFDKKDENIKDNVSIAIKDINIIFKKKILEDLDQVKKEGEESFPNEDALVNNLTFVKVNKVEAITKDTNISIKSLSMSKVFTENKYNLPYTGIFKLNIDNLSETFSSKMLKDELKENIEGKNERTKEFTELIKDEKSKKMVDSIVYIIEKTIDAVEKDGNIKASFDTEIRVETTALNEKDINFKLNLSTNTRIKGYKDTSSFELSLDLVDQEKLSPMNIRFNYLELNSYFPSINIYKNLINSDVIFAQKIKNLNDLLLEGDNISNSFITDIRLKQLSSFVLDKIKNILHGESDKFYFRLDNKSKKTVQELYKEEGLRLMIAPSEKENKKAIDQVYADTFFRVFNIDIK